VVVVVRPGFQDQVVGVEVLLVQVVRIVPLGVREAFAYTPRRPSC
jgi:N-acetylglutamate synthase-like GNAT family acetyltransferase